MMNSSPSWFTAPTLLAATLPPLSPVLQPILLAGGVHLVYGPAGIGKSLFALSIALAAATGGSLLGWRAPRRHSVLVVDSHTRAAELKRRIALFDVAPSSLEMWATAEQGGPLPDFATPEGCAQLMTRWGSPELLVIDLADALGWRLNGDPRRLGTLRHFLAMARRAGRAVLLVNTRRQTTGCEDMIDVVIALRRPADWAASDGVRFELQVEKTHSLAAASFEPMLVRLETPAGAAATWHRQALAPRLIDRVVALVQEGHSAATTADLLGISPSWAYDLQRRARRSGRLLPGNTTRIAAGESRHEQP